MLHRLLPALFGSLAVLTLMLALACQTTPESEANQAPAGAASDAEEARAEPTVIAADEAEVRVAGSGKASITLLAQGQNAFVGRLEMDAGGAVPLHRDATEEYIHILEGGGTITIDGTDYEIGPGSTVYMPANAEVTFQNGDAKLVAIQVFAGPGPASKYDGWEQRVGGDTAED